MTSALTRLVSRQLSVSFEQWKFETEQTRRVQIAVRRAMRIVSAFGQWRRRGEAATVARRSLAHVCYRGLSTGFRMWLEFLGRLHAQKLAWFVGIKLNTTSGLHRGFIAWLWAVTHRLSEGRLARTVSAALYKIQLDRALSRWLMFAADQIQQRRAGIAMTWTPSHADALHAWPDDDRKAGQATSSTTPSCTAEADAKAPRYRPPSHAAGKRALFVRPEEEVAMEVTLRTSAEVRHVAATASEQAERVERMVEKLFEKKVMLEAAHI